MCDPGPDKNPPKENWPGLWEYKVAKALDDHRAVRSFVKNDHIDFAISYEYEEQPSRYLPDFLVSLASTDGSDLTLILEVKGEDDNRDKAKHTYARSWVASVNRDGRYGRWTFEVVRSPKDVPDIVSRIVGEMS